MFRIEEGGSDYVDDFTDSCEIGALARGDIYEGERGVAFYAARWFAEQQSEIELLVVLVPREANGSYHSLAFRYGSKELRLLEPSKIWIDWTPMALPIPPDEANTFHSGARDRAQLVAEFILVQDKAISEYARTFDA
jgi:hypothetical protein